MPARRDYVEAGLDPAHEDPQPGFLFVGAISVCRAMENPAICRAAKGGARRWRGRWRREPDILLLDEPTNHLDVTAIVWLEGELKASRGALVVISHDRSFLENFRGPRCGWTAGWSSS